MKGDDRINYLELSKIVSYILRHAPLEYKLEFDENGWVEADQLLLVLKKNIQWSNVSVNDLSNMITISEKKRHEMLLGKIRALYGHTLSKKIVKEEKKPPQILYHGTAKKFMESIKQKGIIPKGRQYVHLSTDINTAYYVGKRHGYESVVLKVSAGRAWNEGMKFYQGSDKVWLADYITSKYISEIKFADKNSLGDYKEYY